ncbi:GPI ethanolamine phosphate transferase 3 [Scaptodrosophila lebanonensis]|uniref:GPI ethanolamine phosphate transferase 3, catalytic subunit n=1 Tax=Drosophila lebanonensis TaxID=7225 RepID=A0A6J2TEI5_DROLE|nr:GPI ethanolamine phosphate transferase 3 [Scaptodrosophila lebanonensis]
MNITYIFVLIWLAYLISSGVLLFSRGFLLSRVSKTEVSSCRRLSNNPNDEYFLTTEVVHEIFKDVNASSNLCLPQKSKVIVIVVDALKYEFGIYKENHSEPLPFENKLGVLHELHQRTPDNARLMRFKADPPTTTLQRLKGLTTGSLPTFIDIGSNFASPEINEDNVIDQIVKSDLPVVFLGDSTWTDLYPRRFKRAYSYPSFDIFDLDSVDNQIMKHLPKELASDDWQVLIAHFLGVDHCGHKHGPMHAEMSRKLSEMNEIISFVVSQMDNETTLLVMGDHGMTATGDHGGDTDDETNALLFAYSKQHSFFGSDVGSDSKMLQQIDLVPTLSTILGVPIPYSNLGLINFNIVPNVPVPHLSKFQTLLLHSWQNAQQIYHYFYNYAMENKRTFNVEEMDKMETEFILLTHRVKSIYNEAAFKSFVGDLNAHLRNILNICREIWVKFDATQMSQGLLFTFLPIFFAFLLINNSRPSEFVEIFTPKEISYTYLLNFAAGVFGYRYYKNFSFKTEEHGIIFFTSLLSAVILVFFTLKHWSNIANNWANVRRFGHMPTRLLLFTTMGVFFSNSFIIQESKTLSYLLAAVILLLVYEVLKQSVRMDFRSRFKISHFIRSTAFRLILASVLAICFIRFAYTLFRCREEQGNCADFSSSSSAGFSIKKPASGKTYIMAVVIIVLYTTMTRLYLRSCGNLTGNSPNVLLARYGPTVASICAGGHILLANSAIKNIQRTHIDAMALVIYGLLLLQIIVVSVAPLMTFVLPPKNPNSIAVNGRDSIVPEIFKKMKRMYEGDDAERRYAIPVVYGLATVYSSIIITFGIFLAMTLIVLLEPRATVGLIVCMSVGAILLIVHGILRYRTATNFETCVQPTFTAVVGWFLLAHFCFFATSHQTTLSQIDWRAAFVGRTTGIGQSNFISGILVILNTFCGPIFFFCMFTLLSTETFSLFALFPNLIRSNSNRDSTPSTARNKVDATTALADISTAAVGFDMTRGELTLYEYEDVFLGATFKLASQLFMLQGLRIFCAMLACTIHCRHLMVWKIFAPRFIYEGLATFVSLPAIIVGYGLLLRINLAVDSLIKSINKVKTN